MTDVLFRCATEADLPAVIALLADDPLGAGREDASLPLAPAYLDAFAAIEAAPNQLLAVAELDGRVVGTLQLCFLPGLSQKGAWRGQVEAVRVDAGLRGYRIGAKMMEWAVGLCRDRGCRWCSSPPTSRARTRTASTTGSASSRRMKDTS